MKQKNTENKSSIVKENNNLNKSTEQTIKR